MIRRSHLSILVVATLLLAACDQEPAPSNSASSTENIPSASPSLSSTAEVELVVAQSDLGEILTDADGRTLYAFTNDVDGQSVCNDDCATNWPPLTIDENEEVSAAAGVSATWIGSITRDDGSAQVTYSGHPLYYFAADAAPGDTAGQGVGGVWFVLGADGELIGAPEPPAEESADPSSEESDDASASGDY